MNSCNCAVAEVVNIPGLPGVGTPGANGQPAFTVLTSPVTFVNTATPVAAAVGNSTWMAVGQIVFLSDGTNFASCKVTAVSVLSPTAVTLLWQNYNGDGAAPVTVGIGGAVVSAGQQIATPVTVPNGGTGVATLTGLPLFAGTANASAIPYQTGTVTLVAGVKVGFTGAFTITANSQIYFSMNTKGGTLTGAPYLSATPTVGAPGTGAFSVTSGGTTDTSTYNFIILY